MSNSWFFCHSRYFSLPHFPWVHVNTCLNQCNSFCHPWQSKIEESEEEEVSLSTGCPWDLTPVTGGEGGYWLLIIVIVELFINVSRTIYSSFSLGCRFRGRRHLTTVLEGRWQWQEPWWPPLLVHWAEVSGRSRSNSSSHTPQSAAPKIVISQVTPLLSPTCSSKIKVLDLLPPTLFAWYSPFGVFESSPPPHVQQQQNTRLSLLIISFLPRRQPVDYTCWNCNNLCLQSWWKCSTSFEVQWEVIFTES